MTQNELDERNKALIIENNNITRLPKIHKWKKPDTEFFLKL